MANEFKCKNCGYQEGSHDDFVFWQRKAAWDNKENDIRHALELEKEFPAICNNYEKTDAEKEFDKNLKKY